jgi:hypothetical protein
MSGTHIAAVCVVRKDAGKDPKVAGLCRVSRVRLYIAYNLLTVVLVILIKSMCIMQNFSSPK